jgi:hypothetical protein
MKLKCGRCKWKGAGHSNEWNRKGLTLSCDYVISCDPAKKSRGSLLLKPTSAVAISVFFQPRESAIAEKLPRLHQPPQPITISTLSSLLIKQGSSSLRHISLLRHSTLSYTRPFLSTRQPPTIFTLSSGGGGYGGGSRGGSGYGSSYNSRDNYSSGYNQGYGNLRF